MIRGAWYIKGLTISLVFLSMHAFAQFDTQKKISDNEPKLGQQEMIITVFDEESKEALNADILVKGLNSRKTIVMDVEADTTFRIKNYKLYTISTMNKGYMYYNEKFWPDESILHKQEVNLRPIAIGLKTSIQDITFLGDKTEIYHKSVPTLNELVEWLTLNPEVVIKVIGHVNGPDNKKSQRFYNKASEERAQAVVDWLIENKISADRLTTGGAGNTEMIYAKPKTDWQHEANRRIEIEVIYH